MSGRASAGEFVGRSRFGATIFAAAFGSVFAVVPPTKPARAQSNAPSFSCARVTSAVNQMICGSPDLAALDRALAERFRAVTDQGNVDGKALRADEDLWVSTTLKTCSTHECVAAAYNARLTALLDISKRAASPAAYDETRPFPAPDDAQKDAAAHVGQSCAAYAYRASPFAGYTPAAGFLPIIQIPNVIVAPLEKSGSRFAFVLSSPGGDRAKCRVTDVATLPAATVANSFMWCAVDDPSADLTTGFGARAGGKLVAFWTVGTIAPDTAPHAYRAPVDTLGWSGRVRCLQPESGE